MVASLGMFLPLRDVAAIAPPELVISTFQLFLMSTGFAFASFVAVLSTIRLLLTRLWHHHTYRVLLVTLMVTLVIGIGTYMVLYQISVERQLNEARIQIANDMQALWSYYEPVYNATSTEHEARYSLLSFEKEISWNDFQSKFANENYLIVDIREHYAYEAGHIEGSLNVRFADLIRGEWMSLVQYKNQPMLLVCYMGSTGSVAIKFLEEKGFMQLHQLSKGLLYNVRHDQLPAFKGTVDAPGIEKRKHFISAEYTHRAVDKGALLVDMRAPRYYTDTQNLPISTRFFREFMTTAEIKAFLDALDTHASYLAICNSPLSCYQAEIFFEDLLRRNIDVVGVYMMPQPSLLPH